MNSRRLLFISGLALLGAVGAAAVRPRREAEATRVRQYFGPEVWRVVEAAERVEVYRLRRTETEETGKWAELRWPADDLKSGPPVVASREWTERLLSILRRPESYLWDVAKGCAPVPGVVVRFQRAGEAVDLHFCFECEMLSIARTGSLRWEDFDPVRPQLAALIREAFPADPIIQSL